MISATITTFNGKKVNIRIPESGKEIPLKRYFYAKYVFDQINELFGDEKPLNEFSFLKLVVEFLGQVLDIEPNVIMGFNKGSFKDNFEMLLPVKDNMDWESIDMTLYRLYGHVGSVFASIAPKEVDGDFEFEYKGEIFVIPKIFGEYDIWSGEPMPDMPTWMGVELCELEKKLNEYSEKIAPRGEDKLPLPLHMMTDDQQNLYFNTYFRHHVEILACLIHRKDSPNLAWMNGQYAIDLHIKTMTDYLSDIDCLTALQGFFFGILRSDQLEKMWLSNFSSLLRSQLEQFQEPKQ